ncbi:MAG: MFS transporter [Coriobacteriia bacterium]|nr:MFS transporter [Coriobacteriia bacterium]
MPDAGTAHDDASLKRVRALGLVSLLTDASSEAVYPVLPLFLANVIGAPVAAIGLIESLAEATAAIAKVFSGRLSDRLGRRRPLVLAGYSLSNLVKPLFALIPSWPWALALRVADRLGKGVRTAPRDALIADYAPAGKRGEAFGLHRAMDTAGAAIGPLVAWAVLALDPAGYRTVFLISAIPGTLAVLVAIALVRERAQRLGAVVDKPTVSFRGLGRSFAIFAAISMLFGLGNSSDALLVLRAQDLGAHAATVPLMYFAFNVVAASLARLFGRRSDRVGRRRVLVAGFAGYALVYAGFAAARTAWAPWALFGAYGIPYALTEGMARAFVVDLVPENLRATAIGTYTFLLGLATLASSTLAGVLWDTVSPAAPFAVSAALMGVAAFALAVVKPLRAQGV